MTSSRSFKTICDLLFNLLAKVSWAYLGSFFLPIFQTSLTYLPLFLPFCDIFIYLWKFAIFFYLFPVFFIFFNLFAIFQPICDLKFNLFAIFSLAYEIFLHIRNLYFNLFVLFLIICYLLFNLFSIFFLPICNFFPTYLQSVVFPICGYL